MTVRKQTDTIRKNSFEKEAWQNNLVIAGIDEVGRGCLAGPVVAAAVILPIKAKHPLLKDSKIMTPEQRLEAYLWIKKHCYYGVGIVHNRIIDKHNIWHSTLIAMKKAIINTIEASPMVPSVIVVDAMPLKLNDTSLAGIPIEHFYKGESKSISIAAASIVAKVTRDTMMESFNTIIPGYSLANNKGYGTVAHKKALFSDNYSIIHRKSFVATVFKDNQQDIQLSFDSIENLTERIESDETGEIFCRSD